MRAYKSAVTALNTGFGIPDGNEVAYIAFFPLCGGTWPRTINADSAYRQAVTMSGHHGCNYVSNKIRRVVRYNLHGYGGNALFGRNRNLIQIFQRCINGLKVLFYHCLSFFGIGFFNGVFNLMDSFFARQYIGKGKKAGLHNGIDSRTHAIIARYRGGINYIETKLFINNGFLNIAG